MALVVANLLFGGGKMALINTVWQIRWLLMADAKNQLISWWFMCQKQVSRVGTKNYIPYILWDVVTCPCPWYLLDVPASDHKCWDVLLTKFSHKIPVSGSRQLIFKSWLICLAVARLSYPISLIFAAERIRHTAAQNWQNVKWDWCANSLRPDQNGGHFQDTIKCIFLNFVSEQKEYTDLRIVCSEI